MSSLAYAVAVGTLPPLPGEPKLMAQPQSPRPLSQETEFFSRLGYRDLRWVVPLGVGGVAVPQWLVFVGNQMAGERNGLLGYSSPSASPMQGDWGMRTLAPSVCVNAGVTCCTAMQARG